MGLYGITEENYSGLQISQLMDFSGFEKLLTAFNAVTGKAAEIQVSEAKELLANSPVQAD